MSVTLVSGDRVRRVSATDGATLLGPGDCTCVIRCGGNRVSAVFSRHEAVARELVAALCAHAGLAGSDEYGLFVVEGEEGHAERAVELDDDALVGQSAAGRQLSLRKRDADSFRACVLGPAPNAVFRGWLRWSMTAGEAALVAAPAWPDCAVFAGRQCLQTSIPLDQQKAAIRGGTTGSAVLLELRPRQTATPTLVAIVGGPLRALIVSGAQEPRSVGVAAKPGATGLDVVEAVRPREIELSLVGASGLLNLEEPVGEEAGVALQIRGAHEQQQAVMEAAAAAFGSSSHFQLLRGESIVDKIPNVTHWVPGVGKVLGTLLLTSYRLAFVAHDRSTYSDAVESRSSVPLRNILRVARPDSGPSGRLLEISCRNFQVFVFAAGASKHSRSLVSEFVQKQLALQKPFALQAPPSLCPPVRELSWLEEQYRRVFGPHLESGGLYRLSQVNRDYSVCESYPCVVVVPACISDADLVKSSEFRSRGRFLATVWRHPDGPTITRCSQPLVGLGKKRSPEDEAIVAALGASGGGGGVSFIDSRPLANAVANKLTGAGSESQAFYPDCDIRYIGLANIHVVRESWMKLRALCQSRGMDGLSQQGENWLVSLHQTEWLQHVQHVLEGSLTMARVLDRDKRSCVTHCSNGWDRTPQLCSLVQLMLDPYYRTLEGFPRLVHKEWLCFGHRFETRSGTSSAPQEREMAPVFLLFLDCVYQLERQFCTSFEFGSEYLVELYDATLSGQFGTFLFDTEKERVDQGCYDLCDSAWTHLRARSDLRNPHYRPGESVAIFPSTHMALLSLWNRVYLRLPIDATFERDLV